VLLLVAIFVACALILFVSPGLDHPHNEERPREQPPEPLADLEPRTGETEPPGPAMTLAA
jgi:hypothetical protein